VELHNSFERVVFETRPHLRSLKRQAIEAGAAGAVMSGSGASLFALFRQHEAARTFAETLRNEGVRTHLLAL